MQGITKAQPPTTIKGWEWKTPETTMASLGPPVMKPMRHIWLSFYVVVWVVVAGVMLAASSWCSRSRKELLRTRDGTQLRGLLVVGEREAALTPLFSQRLHLYVVVPLQTASAPLKGGKN